MRKQNQRFSMKGRGRHKGLRKHHKPYWFSEMLGRRGPKVERGDTRYLILDSLKEKDRHGYDIMQAIQERTGGVYRPSPGTVYPALQLLEDLEMIASREEGKRKTYALTPKGEQELESQRSLLEDIYEDIGQGQSPEQDQFFEETHQQFMRMFRSISRAYQTGQLKKDTERINKIRQIFQNTVQQVNEVLNKKGEKNASS